MPVNDGVEYGETATGFVAPRFATWRAWAARRAVERFGKNARTESTSRLGWIIDRIAWGLHIVFEAAEGAYNASFYGTAQGVDLDKQLAVFAFARLSQTKSKGELVLFGANLTVVPQGSRVATEDTGQAYETDAAATFDTKLRVVEITALPADGQTWTATINAAPYNYVQQPGDSLELVARGIAAAIGVQAQYTGSYLAARPGGGHMLVIDGTVALSVTIGVVGPGAYVVYGGGARQTITAADYGPTPGFSGTINDIRNPVFGWSGASNQADVSVGRNTETDSAFRARWDRERFGPGKATSKAMKRAFRATEALREAVKAIEVLEVPTQYFTVLIYAPDLTDDQIAQIIEDNRPLGVATDGNTTGHAINANDDEVDVKFDRATVLYVWIKITVTKGEAFPKLGDPATAIAQELSAWGNGGPSPSHPLEAYAGLSMGDDLERFQLGGPINKACGGVKNAVITIASQAFLAPPPGGGDYAAADLVVDPATVLDLDSDRVFVTIV